MIEILKILWRAYNLPEPVAEYRFAPPRKFRLDFAWVEHKVAMEIEGGIWMRGGGGHSHPMWILRDMEKGNLAAKLGWRVFRFTTQEFKNGTAHDFMQKVLLHPKQKHGKK